MTLFFPDAIRPVLASLLLLLSWPNPGLTQEAVGRLSKIGRPLRSVCSGTLVAPDKVLTAAHCVARIKDGEVVLMKNMEFRAGLANRVDAGRASVAGIVLHPTALSARGARFPASGDIALLTLAAPLEAQSLSLADPDPFEPATLIGYRKSTPGAPHVSQPCYGSQAGGYLRLGCRVVSGQSGGAAIQNGSLIGVIVARQGANALAVPIDPWMRAQLP